MMMISAEKSIMLTVGGFSLFRTQTQPLLITVDPVAETVLMFC